MKKGQHIKANGIEYAVKQNTSYSPDPEVKRLSESSRLFNDFGNGFALCCLICLVVAFVRHEVGWFSIPIFLLIGDLILLFAL
jgi:hypothetical protein